VVESRLPKPLVAGSIPVSRSKNHLVICSLSPNPLKSRPRVVLFLRSNNIFWALGV